jgi:manganese transport protein
LENRSLSAETTVPAAQPVSGPAALLKKIGRSLGPGIITAAVVLGPGSVTVCTRSGATMGCSALWVLVMSSVMMIAFTYMGAKIGMMSEEPLLSYVARRYGRWLAVLMGLCGFLICTGFQTGDNVGVGIAFKEMFGGTMGRWAIAFTGVALFLLWGSKKTYRVVEIGMTALVAVMITCFLGNLLRISPSGKDIVAGLVPSRPSTFGLIVAMSATTFSVAAAAFQAYLVRSKGWAKEDVKRGVGDTVIGIAILGGISCIIMITAATVLQPRGIKVNTAVEMAQQLEPLLGTLAKWFFLWGFWAAAFSSFLVNAMVGGTLLSDGLGIGARLDTLWAKILASIVMALGTIAAIAFGDNPIELLVVAQATTILGVPLLAVVMMLLANSRKLMGEHRNGIVLNIMGLISIVWLLYLSFRQASIFLQRLFA